MAQVQVTEIIGHSPISYEAAIDEGFKSAKDALNTILSVWIKDQTVEIQQDSTMNYKVALKFAFIPL